MPQVETVVDAPARSGRFRFRLDDRGRNALALGIVALVFAIPLRGLLRSPGPPMEEGFMLVFPEQVLKGAIPNRDFLHLYGPGSLWALAGVFKVFGVSLLNERLFGLLQQLAIVFGIYALARRWGRILAVSAAVTSALIIIPFGFTALAWVGAVGLAVCGLAAGIEARAATDERRARRFAITAGVLLGLAVLFRPDLVLGVGLSSIALLRGMDRARVKRIVLGFGAGVLPYVIQLATAGPGHAFQGMVIDPVFKLRGGRRLPIPPSWGHFDGFLQKAGALAHISWPLPALAGPHQLFLWFFILLGAAAFVLWQGWQATRAEPHSITARILFVMGLFGVGILPQAMQRVDSGHFSWVSCVVFAFVPIAIFELVRRRAPDIPTRRRRARVRARSMLARPHVRAAGVHDQHLLRLRAADVRHPPRVVQDRARRPHLLLRQARPRRGREHGDRGRGARSRSPASDCSSGPSTCARRRTATRTSTTCSPTSCPPRTTSRWTRAWPTRTIRGCPRTSPRPTS